VGSTKALGQGVTHVAVAFDPETRVMAIYGPSPKIRKMLPSEEDWVKLNINKKRTAVDFAATNLLSHAPTFGGKLYDYKGSGNQIFAATANEKEQCVSFTVPVGKMEPRPKVARKPRAKKEKVATGTAAVPSETEGELVLESA
jgi:outer membrane protein assembly factor BamB